jgi:lysophospholipase L1-like esterase
MPRKAPPAHGVPARLAGRGRSHALLAAAITCLVPLLVAPLLAFAAQQTPPAATPPASVPATSAAPATVTVIPPPPAPPDARAREAGLGLKGPANPNLPSLILIGDSTVRNGHGTGSDGLWGWGAPIADLFDPTRINVVNLAIGGLSSHSYISGGYWDVSLGYVKPGDFVLIQWGHNDGGIQLPGTTPIPDAGLAPGATPPAPPAGAAPRPPNVGGSLPGIGEETLDVTNQRTGKVETVHTYGWYLRKYIADVKAKGATPILCSLVPRKIWDGSHIVRQTATYRGWARAVAEQQHVPFVDLNEIIARRYDAMGTTAVDGVFGDPHTHTNLVGAQLNAECVVSGLRALPQSLVGPLVAALSAKGQAIQPYKV